jgi:predicted nucleotidyltransferase
MNAVAAARSQHLRESLAADSAIAAVYLFGSHARGTATKVSDIDIAVLFHAAIAPSRYFDLRLEYIVHIMEIMRTERVDVVILNKAPLHLAYNIISRGILLLDRDRRQRVAFEADRIGRFLDFKPFLAVQVNAIKAHLSMETYFD